MGVIATNAIQGPAELYVASFGAAEPAETAVGISAAPVSPWVAAGGTTDGVTINVSQEYAKLRFDQIPENIGARLTERIFTVETNMAEGTLENLAIALNVTGPTTGTGVKTLEPSGSDTAASPLYRALIIDGWAPEKVAGVPLRRRIVVRKILSTEGVEFAYQTEDQTVMAVTFEAFFVSTSLRPFRIIDADPA